MCIVLKVDLKGLGDTQWHSALAGPRVSQRKRPFLRLHYCLAFFPSLFFFFSFFSFSPKVLSDVRRPTSRVLFPDRFHLKSIFVCVAVRSIILFGSVVYILVSYIRVWM